MKPIIICIIDDDDVYQYTVSRTIKTSQLAREVLVFSDGEEAINFMIDNVANSTEIPDVIFLDINMPIMDGFEFMEEFVKLKPRVGKVVKIYMVSSSVDPVDMERALKISEISDYIVKPIYGEQIAEIIQKLEDEGTS